jgi:hypothetical protein
MLKLSRPPYTAEETFVACVNRVRDPALRAKLLSVTQMIVDASDAYEAAAEANTLDQTPKSPTLGGRVTAEELQAVYTQRMAKQNAPGRPIYDDIFAAAKGRCPLCAHRTVTTLDHHLPKAYYPALAVTPLNLVPSCSDCNKTKLATVPHTPEDVSIHPYFDDVDTERWLHADVVKVAPAAIRFRVEAPAAWDALLIKRVRRHFRELKLSALYSTEAAEELVNIRHQLVAIHESVGSDEVRSYLDEHAQSCLLGRLNGWRGATYEAWAASDWFCDGGFNASDTTISPLFPLDRGSASGRPTSTR